MRNVNVDRRLASDRLVVAIVGPENVEHVFGVIERMKFRLPRLMNSGLRGYDDVDATIVDRVHVLHRSPSRRFVIDRHIDDIHVVDTERIDQVCEVVEGLWVVMKRNAQHQRTAIMG